MAAPTSVSGVISRFSLTSQTLPQSIHPWPSMGHQPCLTIRLLSVDYCPSPCRMAQSTINPASIVQIWSRQSYPLPRSLPPARPSFIGHRTAVRTPPSLDAFGSPARTASSPCSLIWNTVMGCTTAQRTSSPWTTTTRSGFATDAPKLNHLQMSNKTHLNLPPTSKAWQVELEVWLLCLGSPGKGQLEVLPGNVTGMPAVFEYHPF